VTFGDDLAAATLELQAEALTRMRDTALVERPDPTAEPDPLTGQPPFLPVGSFPCSVKPPVYARSTPEAGGHEWTVLPATISFPAGAFVAAVGQRVTLTACPGHPLDVGRQFRVVQPGGGTLVTALRVTVEEVVA